MINKKLALVLVVILVMALGFASCNQSERYDQDQLTSAQARVNAVETSYTVVEASEEYAGVKYVFPKIEGMVNMSKQADANGNMKRLNTKTAMGNDGQRGAISNTYEVMIANDKLLSVIFPTTLDYNLETRSLVMLVEQHKFIYSIENLFGKAEDNPAFSDMRAVFEAAGTDPSFTDDDFRKKLVYFEGEDMKDLTLHITYFTDKAYDISISFNDVIDYLTEEKAEMFDFAK
ncbi:MAG: hypothetical protein JXB33_05830 [Clostridia bacterium]|nr:hypothetical protein [Clostridia bacterium]